MKTCWLKNNNLHLTTTTTAQTHSQLSFELWTIFESLNISFIIIIQPCAYMYSQKCHFLWHCTWKYRIYLLWWMFVELQFESTIFKTTHHDFEFDNGDDKDDYIWRYGGTSCHWEGEHRVAVDFTIYMYLIAKYNSHPHVAFCNRISERCFALMCCCCCCLLFHKTLLYSNGTYS